MTFKRFLIYWLPVVLYCLFIFIQSSLPSPVSTRGVPLGDKLLHLAGYALLGALFFRAFRASRPDGTLRTLWLLSALATAFYGASDELHQAFVPSRSGDLLDVAADAAGAVLGAGAAAWIAARTAGPLRGNHGLTNLRNSYK
jgi:VanZ family protein